MALPNITSIKKRALSAATSTSTNATTWVTVPFRAKYLYSVVNLQNFFSQAGAWSINLLVNGSTGTADTFVTNPIVSSTTTSTTSFAGGVNSVNANSGVTMFLNEGDTLATSGSSVGPYTVVHILQEF